MLPWLAAAGALIGGIAGGQRGEGGQQTTSMSLAPESELERQARLAQTGGFTQLEDIQRGQLGSEATASANALAQLLQQYQQSGGAPTQADWTQAQQYATAATAPQQQQIDLAMRQAQQQSAQQAGLTGRRPGDFALQTRLGQQRTDAMAALGAQQTAMGAQMAQQFSQNRLGYAGQLNDLKQGLMAQAMQNRMAIMGLGSQIQRGQQDFRRGTASQTTTTPGRTGGAMGSLIGAFQGATGAMGLANMFGGSDAAAAVPASSNNNLSMNNMPAFTMPQLGSGAGSNMGVSYGLGLGNKVSGGGNYTAPIAAFSAPVSQQSPSPAPWNYTLGQPIGPMGLGPGTNQSQALFPNISPLPWSN